MIALIFRSFVLIDLSFSREEAQVAFDAAHPKTSAPAERGNPSTFPPYPSSSSKRSPAPQQAQHRPPPPAADVTRLERQLRETEASLSSALEENGSLHARVREAEAAVQQVKATLEQERKQAKAANKEAMAKQKKQLKANAAAEKQQLQRDLDALRAQLTAAGAEKQQFQAEIAHLKQQLVHFKAQAEIQDSWQQPMGAFLLSVNRPFSTPSNTHTHTHTHALHTLHATSLFLQRTC